MIDSKTIIKDWFKKWETGSFSNLPISKDFKHTSPFGTIEGKDNYLKIVSDNEDKFLGYRFEIQDELYEDNKGCIRYIAIQNDFELEVSEWHYIKNGLISEVVAYYHIGDIRDDRKLKM